MRMARIKRVGETAVNHCFSREVIRQMQSGRRGKEKWVELLVRLSAIGGVEVWGQP